MSFRHYFWTKGEPWNGIRSWLAPRVLHTLHAGLMCSVRLTASGEDRARPFRRSEQGEGGLLVAWHDLTMVPLHVVRGRPMSVIASHSRSGRVNAAFLQLLGYQVVWGSTGKREGIQALREVLPQLRAGRLILVAPDGPKGPRHRVQPGIIYMAARAPAAIYPWGVAASAAWRLSTWDRHLIPKPFSHVHLHMGAPLELPADLSREDIPFWQETIRQAMDAAETEAQKQLADMLSTHRAA